MKSPKITTKKKMVLYRISMKKFRRKQTSKAKKLNKNRAKSGWIPQVTRQKGRVRREAPELFILSKSSHKNVVRFLRRIRKITLENKQSVWINFTSCRIMGTAATLLLIAEIERIQTLMGKNIIRGSLPKNSIASQVFQKTGLSELLNINYEVKIEHESVTYWDSYLTGEDAAVKDAARELVKIKLKRKFMQAFYTSISEAIINITMHAYDNVSKRADGHPFIDNKWWMFTGSDEKNLTLVVCDIGKGIPVALENRTDYTNIKAMIDGLVGGKESKSIKAAMAVGQSSSMLSHRGKGMKQLKRAIDIMQAGGLYIYSNRGLYTYSSSGKESYTKDFKYSIMGTIIEWTAPLDKLQMMSDEQNND